ncbi:MAG: hypothetical protein PHY92_08330 [Alphaproteobacteria bacterium]|nr:hypothetical protein [Alphaproteobacteria bacterium]
MKTAAIEQTARRKSLWRRIGTVAAVFGVAAALVTTLLAGKINVTVDRNAMAQPDSGKKVEAPQSATVMPAPMKAVTEQQPAPLPSPVKRKTVKTYRALAPKAAEVAVSKAVLPRGLEAFFTDKEPLKNGRYLKSGQAEGLSEVIPTLSRSAQARLARMASEADASSPKERGQKFLDYCHEASRVLSQRGCVEAAEAMRMAGLRVAKKANLFNTGQAIQMLADQAAKLYQDGNYAEARQFSSESLRILIYANKVSAKQEKGIIKSASAVLDRVDRVLAKKPGLKMPVPSNG